VSPASLACAHCQTPNPPSHRYCVECGQALPAACPRCGFAHEAGARFCGGCGHPIAPPAPIADRFASPDAYTPPDLAEKIRTARGAVEGERKQVTVLFADMKGSLAVRHCESALEGAQALGMRPLAALCRLDLGALAERTGRRDEAREHLETAVRMLRAMDMRHWLPGLETALASLGGARS
jgi:double zinc ribbon protein/tetratricopeptide repeat protein